MSILADALDLYGQKMRSDVESANRAVVKAFRDDFFCEPDGVSSGSAVLGDLRIDKGPGTGLWYASIACETCGDKHGETLLLEPDEPILLTLGRAAFACYSWLADHTCTPPVDSGEIRRALEYAAGKIEKGSACDAELYLQLATAMILEGILKKLSQ